MIGDIGKMLSFLFFGCIALAALVVILAGGWAWSAMTGPGIEAEAIQRGYALHCPQTGDFAWKGECDD